MPTAIGILVVIAVIVLFTLQRPSAPSAATTGGGLSAPGRTAGDPNAKLKVVEYADFQCPICREFAIGTEPQIDAQYIKTGKISFTYNYFPVVDQGTIGESNWAAEAAECANQQGKFWEYHDKLYAVWTGEHVGDFTKPKLEGYAAQLGLDTAKFNQCLETDQTASVVRADEQQATKLGLPGTPSFLVNGKVLQWSSLDFGEFSRTFDSLLK
ncbi:MAG: DsbA family protein [Chloroflexi bacterium]|nr:DsbA family protein [Chloroflexota bacterium]